MTSSSERRTGLQPVVDEGARVLILGTLPGEQSLLSQEYYANKRNLFWNLMGEIVGADWRLPYLERLRTLKGRGIALWDVLGAARRTGSSDASIRDGIPNDFTQFLWQHRGIRRILFNGKKAGALFDRLVWPGLGSEKEVLGRQILPSTSPANVRLSRAEKLRVWGEALSM